MDSKVQKYLSIKELRLLAGALGFTRNLVQTKIPNHVIIEQAVLLQDLVYYCEEGFFAQELHFTYNNKTGNYNTEVLKRAAILFAKNLLTINEIRDARMAFETYEQFDQRGMLIDARVLIRTIKIIGRTVAPEKLIKKIRHVKVAYHEKGRIQLYEFLDLLPLCRKLPPSTTGRYIRYQDDENDVLKSSDVTIAKTWRGIYCVDDFHKFMVPADEQRHRALNAEYHHEQLSYQPPVFVHQPLRSHVITNQQFHQHMDNSRRDGKMIRNRLIQSKSNIKLSRSGANGHRLEEMVFSLNSEDATNNDENCEDDEGDGILHTWRQSLVPQTDAKNEDSGDRRLHVDATNNYSRRKPIKKITGDENINTKIEDLSFAINTQDMRMARRVNLKMSELLGDEENCKNVRLRVEAKKKKQQNNGFDKLVRCGTGNKSKKKRRRINNQNGSAIKLRRKRSEDSASKSSEVSTKKEFKRACDETSQKDQNQQSYATTNSTGDKEKVANSERRQQFVADLRSSVYVKAPPCGEAEDFLRRFAEDEARSRKAEVERRRGWWRNRKLDSHQKEAETQTSGVTDFERFVSAQFSTGDIEGRIEKKISSPRQLDVGDEMKLRLSVARMTSRRCDGKKSLYVTTPQCVENLAKLVATVS